jgi:hypothetical protein
MRAAALLSAIILALSASVGAASATTVTFDNANGSYGRYYIENGLLFVSAPGGIFSSWGAGNAFTADSSGVSSTLYQGRNFTPTTLTKLSGDSFHLNSIDFAEIHNNDAPIDFQVTFNFTGAGSQPENLHLEGAGLHTFSFAMPPVDSVIWTPTGGADQWLQWDNVVVDAVATTTPVPATLPLLASALGVLAFVGWRRRQASAA